MRISLEWLKAYVDVPDEPERLAERLTMAGIEVSSVEVLGRGIEDVVVGKILEKGQHPGADRLSLCRVTDGRETYPIVCGATNMKAGDRVALARIGASLPGGLKIKKAKLRGEVSEGMLCSEAELGLSEDHSGIMILPEEAELGARLVDVLGLPDAVLEVEITPNRPDCLSVVGVAREVAALTGRDLRIPEPRLSETGPAIARETSVEILAPDLCHRYAARFIRGVRLGPSPLWMRRRLQASGVRSISNVVDVTNYVLLEFGHPLHAFDFRKLRGGRIVVRRAGDGELFTTLDGQERKLDADCLTICDAVGAVALAGVMGGLNSEVSDDTVDVLLESAYFLPSNIRRTSKKLGLRSEASYRFERGTDIEGLLRALDRTAELIGELASGTLAAGIWDAYPTPHQPARVRFRPAKATAVLGLEVGSEEAAGYLRALGMKTSEESSESEPGFWVDVPTHRVDVEREIDLIEEVARMKGFDLVPTTLPRVPMSPEPPPKSVVLTSQAKEALTGLGFREAITFSFVDPAEDERIGLPADSGLRPKIALQNPLSQETAVLRTMLLPGLLQAGGLNARRQTRDFRLFEVGKTFHPRAEGKLPEEILRAGALLAGRRSPVAWWATGEEVDFYDAKGAVEALLSRLGVQGPLFQRSTDLPWLHPGRSVRILAGERELGWVGEVHPARLSAYELVAPVCAFEVDLLVASEVSGAAERFRGLDRYPAVERDIALLADRSVLTADVLEAIGSVGSKLIRSAVLFDAFEGKRLPEGKVSLAFRITYRSDERTLTEEEVTKLEDQVLRRIADRTGAKLREA
ncbi:MAG: phenylalanine--tRNA ligase subunit beta [Deltaproteobacteria bacterium]|nr:phenylalanine--tRNA ligase subunit beta [Deltaproteobacteria bacterium]